VSLSPWGVGSMTELEGICCIRLLGGLEVRQGERTTTRFRTHKAGSLLAYLAYHLEGTHPREVLAELLWPGARPVTGRANLRVELASLRHQLEPPGMVSGTILSADRFSVQLRPPAVSTDVAAFHAALAAATSAPSRVERVQALEEAVGLYCGELLPGHYEDWVAAEQRRLADLHFGAVRRLTRNLVGEGEAEAALTWARRATAADPLREEAHQDVIRLLVATGQQSAALCQYRELERVLKDGLGAEPSPESRRLLASLPTPTEGTSAAGTALDPQPESPRACRGSALPLGTVTLLLTDVDGSAALWEQKLGAFAEELERRNALLRRSFRRHGGHEVKETRDSFVVAFAGAGDATACAVECQRSLAQCDWSPATGPLQVRMAIHAGARQLRAGRGRGRAARPDTAWGRPRPHLPGDLPALPAAAR
jgi:DNA-binding SARP family transcriptional activator